MNRKILSVIGKGETHVGLINRMLMNGLVERAYGG